MAKAITKPDLREQDFLPFLEGLRGRPTATAPASAPAPVSIPATQPATAAIPKTPTRIEPMALPPSAQPVAPATARGQELPLEMGRLTDLYGQLETAAQRKPQKSLLQTLDQSGFMAAMPRREFFRVFPSLLEDHLKVQAGQGARFDELLETLRAGREIQQVGLEQQRMVQAAEGLKLDRMGLELRILEAQDKLTGKTQQEIEQVAAAMRTSGLDIETVTSLADGTLQPEKLPAEKQEAARRVVKLTRTLRGSPQAIRAAANLAGLLSVGDSDTATQMRLMMGEGRRGKETPPVVRDFGTYLSGALGGRAAFAGSLDPEAVAKDVQSFLGAMTPEQRQQAVVRLKAMGFGVDEKTGKVSPPGW